MTSFTLAKTFSVISIDHLTEEALAGIVFQVEGVVENGADFEEMLQLRHGCDGIQPELLTVDHGNLLRWKVEQPPIQMVSVHPRTQAPFKK